MQFKYIEPMMSLIKTVENDGMKAKDNTLMVVLDFILRIKAPW